MKSNKVLLGLFVGFLALTTGNISAQNGNHFFEVGPSNVGGAVSSLVVDKQDTSHITVYAGAVSGGLFVRSDNTQFLNQLYTRLGLDTNLASNTDIWHNVPYVNNGKEDVLPINCMVQGPDNYIYIGTGDNTYPVGTLTGPMSMLGKGIYRFNTEDGSFTMVPNTKPTSTDDDFAAVKAIDYIYRDNTLYLFAVTNKAIYRWKVAGNNETAWNTKTKVFEGEVKHFVINRQLKTAYFSTDDQLYKIGDVTVDNINCVNISESNSAFGLGIKAIHLATATKADTCYLYAMVVDSLGGLEGLYLTTNGQTWNTLTTSTVQPFGMGGHNGSSYGDKCGYICIDPGNPKRVYIGGDCIYGGEGFLENGYYQWSQKSLSEVMLNAGNYMAYVYNSASFVHSGIHQIVPVYRVVEGEGQMIYFIATDGGVYMTNNNFGTFSNLAACLNNVEINHLAVCPDGSIISGARFNAVPIIDSRSTHDGGSATLSWFDDGSLGNFNHDANIIWHYSGGKVAASRFQQISPLSRRNIFVSSGNGSMGRAYADYLDYTNTQTWTSGTDFTSDAFANGPEIGELYLWETDNNTIFTDSVTFVIDTLGVVIRGGDTVPISGSNFQIRTGDKMVLQSRGNSEYPFEYTFKKNQKASEKVRVQNPIQARMLAIAQRNGSNTNNNSVFLAWRASDYSKVWNADEEASANNDITIYDRLILWAPMLNINKASNLSLNVQPRTMTMSTDGRFVFVAAQNMETNQSMIIRVSGFENVNYSDNANTVKAMLTDPRLSTVSVLQFDTLLVNGNDAWFPRAISSLAYDNRNNGRLVVTFEGYSTAYANVAVINNATANYSVEAAAITGKATIPAYSAIVEKTTGNIYVGTSDGVFVRNNNTWTPYANLQGVPVTSIAQQIHELPVRHHIGHNGINEQRYVFAKTKWPNAMYFGTYGRGIFMDMQYVTDTVNEICDPEDYTPVVGIPTVYGSDLNSVKVYPNPVSNEAHLELATAVAGKGVVRVYDLNGRCIISNELGHVSEGSHEYSIDCSYLPKGMYLVNITVGNQTAATKMMVR